jgi:hypothetical protein
MQVEGGMETSFSRCETIEPFDKDQGSLGLNRAVAANHGFQTHQHTQDPPRRGANKDEGAVCLTIE